MDIIKKENLTKEAIEFKNHDRIIYVEKKDGFIIGLNFMQGDDVEYFYKEWYKTDEKLTRDYINFIKTFDMTHDYDLLNKFLWFRHELMDI